MKMDIKIEKKIETMLYGIVAAMFMTAFFFGLLYPEYGFVSADYQAVSETKMQTTSCIDTAKEDEQEKAPLTITYMGNLICAGEMNKMKQMKEDGRIVYTSYLYECFKRAHS